MKWILWSGYMEIKSGMIFLGTYRGADGRTDIPIVIFINKVTNNCVFGHTFEAKNNEEWTWNESMSDFFEHFDNGVDVLVEQKQGKEFLKVLYG